MNRIYQGRVSKVQRLKAGAFGVLASRESPLMGSKWRWTIGGKRVLCLRPCATDHLFSAIDEGKMKVLRRRGSSQSQILVRELCDSDGREWLTLCLTDIPRIGYGRFMRPKFFTLTQSFKFTSALTMLGAQEDVDSWLEDITWMIASNPTSPDFPVVRLPDLRCAEVTVGSPRKKVTLCIYFRIFDESHISLEWLCIGNFPQQEMTTITAWVVVTGSV